MYESARRSTHLVNTEWYRDSSQGLEQVIRAQDRVTVGPARPEHSPLKLYRWMFTAKHLTLTIRTYDGAAWPAYTAVRHLSRQGTRSLSARIFRRAYPDAGHRPHFRGFVYQSYHDKSLKSYAGYVEAVSKSVFICRSSFERLVQVRIPGHPERAQVSEPNQACESGPTRLLSRNERPRELSTSSFCARRPTLTHCHRRSPQIIFIFSYGTLSSPSALSLSTPRLHLQVH